MKFKIQVKHSAEMEKFLKGRPTDDQIKESILRGLEEIGNRALEMLKQRLPDSEHKIEFGNEERSLDIRKYRDGLHVEVIGDKVHVKVADGDRFLALLVEYGSASAELSPMPHWHPTLVQLKLQKAKLVEILHDQLSKTLFQ